MSIQYARDDGTQMVIVTLSGEMPSVHDIREVFHRHRAESVWHYGTLYDLRRMTGRPSFNYLRDLIANAASFVPGGKTRGPVALLATDPDLYRIAAAFVEFERAKPKLHVFREIGPAKAWLTKETNGP